MKQSVVILCAGGPAPGINTVVASVSKVFLKHGFNVIGLKGGYKSLFTDEVDFINIDYTFAEDIYSRGGSALKMSRYKPKDSEFKTDFFEKHNVKILVTVGGDDTASTANRISKFLAEKKLHVQNIHVPKTIDNDLPLQEGIPTFGYQTAKEEGSRIALTINEDARTNGTWFVCCAMGREAGHLAFGIGTACHLPMIIIPEMFEKTEVTFSKIIDLMISSIIKRKLLGIDYGVIMISEGVFHFISDEEINKSGIHFTYDEHGHPELGALSKSHIFDQLLQKKLKALDIKVKSRPNEMGYELRCVRPIAYDLVYCTILGAGVFKLFKEGKTGCMVTLNKDQQIVPLYLNDVQDEKGKVKPRLVNMQSDKIKIILENNLHFISAEDYSAAGKIVQNPEEFDFLKILNM